jgi:hypothetical protein
MTKIVEAEIKAENLATLKSNIKLEEWTPDEYSLKLLDNIKNTPPSYKFVRMLLRKSVVPEDVFDVTIHHNILTTEAILTNL